LPSAIPIFTAGLLNCQAVVAPSLAPDWDPSSPQPGISNAPAMGTHWERHMVARNFLRMSADRSTDGVNGGESEQQRRQPGDAQH
jgi:hypothetical protein